MGNRVFQSMGTERAGRSAGGRVAARFVGMAVAVELSSLLAVCAWIGPARIAEISGWDRMILAWQSVGCEVDAAKQQSAETSARLPRPANLDAETIRPDLTYREVARIVGAGGTRLLKVGPRVVSRRGEATYRWYFDDGSDLTATFEDGHLVIFSLAEPG